MAIITVSTNITNSTPGTDALTLASGDTVNLLPNVGIFNYAAGRRHSRRRLEFLHSQRRRCCRDGLARHLVDAGNNDINIGAASLVVGGAFREAIFIIGGHNAIGIAGTVVSTSAGDETIGITGPNNTINVLAGGEVFGDRFRNPPRRRRQQHGHGCRNCDRPHV